ncbi:hypothetical protein MNV49_000102 [Pseudohyphozyma bogoriensis]|nr:hypothetical protein MNV49_000102 [Pseudohyphozyma bogoriensis]
MVLVGVLFVLSGALFLLALPEVMKALSSSWGWGYSRKQPLHEVILPQEFAGVLNSTVVEVVPPLPGPQQGDEHYVGICTSVRGQVFDLPEWIRHHYYHLGIHSMYIFDDGTLPPLADQLSEFELGVPRSAVNFIYYSEELRSEHQQMYAYNECVRMFGRRHTWLALIDGDEYLEMVDPTVSLQSFLREFDGKAAAVGVQWIIHNSAGQVKRPPRGACRQTFTSCIADPPKEHPDDNSHIKSIVKTDQFLGMIDPHHADMKGNLTTMGELFDPVPPPGYFRYPPTRERIVLHHYAVKSWEEYEQKMRRGSGMDNHKGMAFWDRVEGSVSHVCDSLARYTP